MSERTSFYRKIGYALAIVAIGFVLVWLSSPAAATKEGGMKEGGKLAQLRDEYGLSQANMGDIDPASETIKLATLGLRGIAVNLLWEKANHYKKVEDWTNLTATLEQLAKLQPNFITFWKFQAWNLTYNVSVEFDDYKDRYYYVRRGIQFLQDGERYNEDNPVLLWDLGWFVGQKIGRADEYVQYRELFKEDDDYHPADRTMEERDNWLVGKDYYLQAIDSVDNKGFSLGRKSPRDFYSSPAKSQMNYSEAIEEEGFFTQAKRAWARAAEEWRQFGETVIEHSTGVKLQLGSQPRLEEEVAELRSALDALLPGTRDKLAQEKLQALTTEERELLEIPAEKLTPEQASRRYEIEQKPKVTDREVAERIVREKPEIEKQALKLASDLARKETVLQYTTNYKRDANYDYWQTRADFEQTDNAIAAREKMYQANQAFRLADVERAKKLYEEGFAKWRQVIDAFPAIMNDEATTGDDLLDFVEKYRKVLDQLDERIADDFPLWDVIEKFDREMKFTEELTERRQRLGLPADSSAASQPPPSGENASDQPQQPADSQPADEEPPAQPSADESQQAPAEPSVPENSTAQANAAQSQETPAETSAPRENSDE
jgi:hypothetical protein